MALEKAMCIICGEKSPTRLTEEEQDDWHAYHKRVGCSKHRIATRDAVMQRDDDADLERQRSEARRLSEGLAMMFGEDGGDEDDE